MKFCDKVVFLIILIILIIALHYLLPKLNNLIDGKEGMKNKNGGVLSTTERPNSVKPNTDINTNGDANGDANEESGDANVDNDDANDDSKGSSYHVHYHINSDNTSSYSKANLTHMPTGDPQQDVMNAQSQLTSVDESSESPQTSEYTRQYPCESSLTGMFTECGPPAANIQCLASLYGACINQN